MVFKNRINKVLTIGFLILIVLPNVVMFLGLENHLVSNENKMRKAFPKVSLKNPIAAIKVFKSYYTENYGLKKTFVNSYISFKEDMLNETPIPNRVVKGKDGWLFLGNHSNKSLNNSFGIDTFSSYELNSIVNYLKQVKTYLASKNIAFYVVVAPNKNTIYQEKLPFRIPQNLTKLDAFKEAVNKEDVKLIDLRELLKNSKDDLQLYMKTDTHWNDYGAFISYQNVIDKIKDDKRFYDLCKMSIKDFNITTDSSYIGDISGMINDSTKTNRILFEKKYKSSITVDSKPNEELHFFNSKEKINAVIHYDSFSNAWMPYMIESFGKSIFVKNHQLNKTIIESHKPDIVIFEIVERNIDVFLKQKAP